MARSHSLEQKIKELDEFIKTNPDVRELKRVRSVKLALQGWRYEANCAELLNLSKSFISPQPWRGWGIPWGRLKKFF